MTKEDLPMQLFYSPGACSRASHIALEETGAKFEAIRIDFTSGTQNSPEYLAINPKGRVPALVAGPGTLTETSAILAWVAQAHPEAGLAPTDPWDFAQMQSFNAYLASTVHVNHAHGRRGARWTDDPAAQEGMRAKVGPNMTACFTYIETLLDKGPWVMGAQYTVADPYLFTVSGWLKSDGVDIADFPRTSAHREAMLARPAVQAVLARESA
ncbi:glutathione S-transferase [Paroceanicella profunda]|uniref:Glutathione S-transferase n=1 Tax=Paroceanicella profunda TaxID=2579971 RepID=A0A5B8FUG6_9RHOB|nr:glutathione S-transferase N-terminal domain-containing protein [Paroceanicella profunda]QDL92386.1 glutathione S-transferase [Paroceanicella profunda]